MIVDTYPSYPSAYPSPYRVTVPVTPPAVEPLTRAQAKLAAGLDWPDFDPRDQQIDDFLAAARMKVELDSGVALLAQTYDVRFDWLPSGYAIPLPWRPVTSAIVTSIDGAGVEHVLDPALYRIESSSAAPTPARIALVGTSGDWPTDLAPFLPWTVRTVVGFESVEALRMFAAGLYQAVSILVAHYATVGRDAVITGTIATSTPLGYADVIAPFQLVTLT